SSLILVLGQLGRWLGWKDWTSGANTYYQYESTEEAHCLYDDSLIDGLRIPAQPFPPSSIFQHLESWISGSPSSFPFLTLGGIAVSNHDHPSWQMMAKLTPGTLAILSLIEQTDGQLGYGRIIDNILSSDVSENVMGTLPDGIAAAFYQAIASKRIGLHR